MTRRSFGKALAISSGALPLGQLTGHPRRRLKAGHTGITWGFKPEDAEQAITDVGNLGFHGYETFGQVLEGWESKGGLKRVLDAHNLPLISGYCTFNMVDPTKRSDEIEKMLRWGRLIKNCGGRVSVMGPNPVDRNTYDFNAHRGDIITSLNETSKALTDLGLTPVLHQHTGTCVMTRDEVYGVMEKVDTRYVKFGPDVGQLAKGGNDPVQVVKDFLPIIRHVHLKDWDGGPYWLEYCPLGRGKVNLPKVLDLLESSGNELMIMAELDPSPNAPMTPLQTATINRNYQQSQGYTFGSKQTAHNRGIGS
ncbi:MAG TPA: sugar phosphate isomerase/epimerase [Bryobacteraceae bacterium]|nr:sugar phosphate isomerase/epimerase [Bryobacteraceae bacterium]